MADINVTLNFKNINDKLYFDTTVASPTFTISEGPDELPHSVNGMVAVTFNQPFLFVPRDYYLTVMRLSVPLGATPGYLVDVYDKNASADGTVFVVGIKYEDVLYTERVQWVPQYDVPNTDPKYYWGTNVRHLLKCINNAFSVALGNIPDGPEGAVAPIVLFDDGTRLFSIKTPQEYYVTNVDGEGATLEIYINQPLNDIIGCLDTVTIVPDTSTPNIRVLMVDYGNNYFGDTTDLLNTQSISTVSRWSAVKSVHVMSATLNTIPEYFQSNTNASEYSNIPILKDFMPLLGDSDLPMNGINFVNSGPFQLINLTGNDPLRVFNFQFMWTDKFGNMNPINVPYNQTIMLKLGFFKKSTWTS